MALLSLRPLAGFANINTYQCADAIEIAAGCSTTVYFQLVDVSVNKPTQGFNPSGLRYCPSNTATLQIVLNNIDTAKKITRFASIVSTNDTSIWSLTINATDAITGTVNVSFTLTDGISVTSGTVTALILAHDSNQGMI